MSSIEVSRIHEVDRFDLAKGLLMLTGLMKAMEDVDPLVLY